ncbi:hypothetical protein QTP88_011348 [Uroleucon formosanum]
MDGIQIFDKKISTTILSKKKSIVSHDRQITVKYCLQIDGKQEQICKKLFQNTYGIGRGKIDVMVHKKRSSTTGISPTSGRGLHQPHNYNAEAREIILNHIKSFPTYESHYLIKHTSLLYLSSSLNIQKMYDLYKEYCHENNINNISSYWLYRTIFSETGLKFKVPYIDTCKTCDEFKTKSKHFIGNDLQILTNKNQEHQDIVEYAYNSKRLDKLRLDQNRNMNVALMFMFAIQKHSSLQIIDQKFLVPGHIHLKCDSDHARIERYKKQSVSIIAIPMGWYNFLRSVRGKVPLKVVEIEQEHFKSFSTFLSGPLVKRNVDTHREKINWLKIKWLRYDKQFGIIQFKYSLDEDTQFRLLD